MYKRYIVSCYVSCAIIVLLGALGGCAAQATAHNRSLELLLANCEEQAARRLFLDLLRSNAVEDQFLAMMARPSMGPQDYTVELVRSLPGTNGLVLVQVRPDPEYVPGEEDTAAVNGTPERVWFFFDRHGYLLAWSNEGGTWLVEDVTGEGAKDLLVSCSKPKGAGCLPYADARVYYTLFRMEKPEMGGIPFGCSAPEQLLYGFTMIHLMDSSAPLVMTYEGKYPLEDKDGKHAEWKGTVIRSFKGGRPRLVLVVSDVNLYLVTNPGGYVFLRTPPSPFVDDKKYELEYNCVKRRFELKMTEDAKEINPVEFSANVPR